MNEHRLIGALSLGAPAQKGPKGDRGPIGPQGPQGIQGIQGEKGERGEVGPRGIQGMPGPQGIQGIKGDQGPKGDIGPKGPKGDKGDQGVQGPQGAQGPRGIQGIKGDTGEQGPRGFDGFNGPIGPQGPQGRQGEQGPRGEIGPGFRLVGEANRKEDIREPKEQGDCYFITSTKEVVMWTGSKWVNFGVIKGPRGDQGPRGIEGPIGAQGPMGERGPIGERGEQGPKGDVGEAAIVNTKISNVNTWSSKHIIDHLLQDNDWKTYDNAPELTDATNGYIKGLEIEGQTVKSDEDVQGVGLKTEKGYKIGVKTHGKNLFNINDISNIKNGQKVKFNNLECLAGKDGPQNLTITNKFKENTQYTFTSEVLREKDGKDGAGVRIRYTDGTSKVQTFEVNRKSTIVSDKTKTIKAITVDNRMNKNYYLSAIQLEEGTQATKYEPYKESTSEIILQDQLQGIGDIKDKLYFDEGYKVDKKNGKIVLSGGEPWNESPSISTETLLCCFYEFANKKVGSQNIICDKFNNLRTSSQQEEGIAGHFGNGKNIYIKILKSRLETPNVEGLKKWLKANNPTIVYELATPTTTDTQIKAELLPQTYKNKTYIDKDMGVSGAIKGEYAIDDFKKKIDDILLSHGLIKAPHTTLEELEEDEPTTLEEFQDEPTTLEGI